MRNVVPSKKQDTEICCILYGSRYNIGMKSFGVKHLFKNHYGHTLLHKQIQAILQAYPKAEIIVVSGFESDKIARLKDNRFRIVENQLFQETNEVEDVRLALNNTHSNNILFIHSDLYFNHYTLHNLSSENSIIYDSRLQLSEQELGITVVDNLATRLDFKLSKKWCNILSLNGKALDILKNLLNKSISHLYMFEIINTILDKDVKIKAFEPLSMKILKIDTPDQYRKYLNLV